MKTFLLLIACLTSTLFCMAQTGNVGIGTTTPTARLHVTDSSVLFNAAGTANFTGNPPITGAGRRMMWWPGRAAFRTGYVSGSQWDKDSIGVYSFAAGYNAKATGAVSNAFGYLTTARGVYSTAMGYNTLSGGDYSFATGHTSTASGDVSAALGFQLYARSVAEVAVGLYNTDYTPSSSGSIVSTDRAFSVGTGTTSTDRRNALTVFKNGRVAFGNIDDPQYQFTNTNYNTVGSDGQGGNYYGLSWQADQPGYAVQFYNGFNTSIPNGLAVKVLSNAGTALDVSQGAQEAPGNSLLIVKSAGNVGIGTNNPGQKLDVNGIVRATEVVTPETGNASMLAAAYGVVYSNTTNTIVSSSGNCTVSHTAGTGIYNITFTGSSLSGAATGNLPIVISPYGTTPGFVSWTGNTGSIAVYTFGANGVATDRGFSFVVYKP